jgi:transcriptional regulator of arginine metabolism
MHNHAARNGDHGHPRPVTKAHRQAVIRSLVSGGSPPRSQGEVLGRLRAAGVRVTQSTLSRDLRDLGLVKGPAGYGEAGGGLETSLAARRMEMERMMRGYLTGVARAGNLVVLRTTAGMAHALGVALDRARLDEVVGTVAGDDTLFAAAPDPSRARSVELRLRGLIGRR